MLVFLLLLLPLVAGDRIYREVELPKQYTYISPDFSGVVTLDGRVSAKKNDCNMRFWITKEKFEGRYVNNDILSRNFVYTLSISNLKTPTKYVYHCINMNGNNTYTYYTILPLPVPRPLIKVHNYYINDFSYVDKLELPLILDGLNTYNHNSITVDIFTPFNPMGVKIEFLPENMSVVYSGYPTNIDFYLSRNDMKEPVKYRYNFILKDKIFKERFYYLRYDNPTNIFDCGLLYNKDIFSNILPDIITLKWQSTNKTMFGLCKLRHKYVFDIYIEDEIPIYISNLNTSKFISTKDIFVNKTTRIVYKDRVKYINTVKNHTIYIKNCVNTSPTTEYLPTITTTTIKSNITVSKTRSYVNNIVSDICLHHTPMFVGSIIGMCTLITIIFNITIFCYRKRIIPRRCSTCINYAQDREKDGYTLHNDIIAKQPIIEYKTNDVDTPGYQDLSHEPEHISLNHNPSYNHIDKSKRLLPPFPLGRKNKNNVCYVNSKDQLPHKVKVSSSIKQKRTSPQKMVVVEPDIDLQSSDDTYTTMVKQPSKESITDNSVDDDVITEEDELIST